MRKEDWIKIILVLSLIGNGTLLIKHKRDSEEQELKYELLNANIYRDLTQLETTIQNQIDNNWDNEPLISQKLDDAIDSIILYGEIDRDDDKEELLLKLYDYLKEFRVGDETLVSLTAK